MGTVKIVNFQRVLKLGPLFKERLFFKTNHWEEWELLAKRWVIRCFK